MGPNPNDQCPYKRRRRGTGGTRGEAREGPRRRPGPATTGQLGLVGDSLELSEPFSFRSICCCPAPACTTAAPSPVPPRAQSAAAGGSQPRPPLADCPLTFRLAGQGLADHARVVLLVGRPLIHKEGCVGGPSVEHDPELGVTLGSGGRGAGTAHPSFPGRAQGRTLVSVGRRTLTVPTRMRSSAVRPETAAAPSRALKTRCFQVSPMVGAGLAPVGPRGAPRLRWLERSSSSLGLRWPTPAGQQAGPRTALQSRGAPPTPCMASDGLQGPGARLPGLVS